MLLVNRIEIDDTQWKFGNSSDESSLTSHYSFPIHNRLHLWFWMMPWIHGEHQSNIPMIRLTIGFTLVWTWLIPRLTARHPTMLPFSLGPPLALGERAPRWAPLRWVRARRASEPCRDGRGGSLVSVLLELGSTDDNMNMEQYAVWICRVQDTFDSINLHLYNIITIYNVLHLYDMFHCVI